ncbi:putative phage abortive infection protein [Niallia circulans]
MKIIQETVFDDSSIENNEKEKKKYRGILRAQLSSFELLMLFYNVVYSDKGEISKNF